MWPHFKLNKDEAVKKVSLCAIFAFLWHTSKCGAFQKSNDNLTITNLKCLQNKCKNWENLKITSNFEINNTI